MKTKEECMELIKSCADTMRHRFGVSSFRLFGSVAREEQQADSDVDMCVEMVPKLYLLVELGMYLEELLGCRVDVIRMHRNMNAFLRKEIEKDGIFIL